MTVLYCLRGENYYRINFGHDNARAMRLKCVLGECVHSHHMLVKKDRKRECVCACVCVRKRDRVREIEEEKKIDNTLTRAAYGVRYAGNNDVSGPSMCYSAKFSYAFSITHDAVLIFLLLVFFLRLHFTF